MTLKFRSVLASFFMVALSLTHLVALASPKKVGLVLGLGGRDDKSFNSASVEGLRKAVREMKIDADIVESVTENYAEQIEKFAKEKKDLIISVGFLQTEAMNTVAKQYPAIKFAIVDGKVDLPNVSSLLFEEHEGSYLVGALAALKSKSGKIGFIGGMDIPVIRRFQAGYEAGAKKINPKVVVVAEHLGTTPDAWNNPPKAKTMALAQFDAGSDVVFAAAGASGAGVFEAAQAKNKFAIGVDSNQNWLRPGFILTSMLKRVDVAVFQSCKDVSEGKFTGGVKSFGLKNEGVDFAMDKFNAPLVSPVMLKKVNALKKDIVSGKIVVPNQLSADKN